MRDALPKRTPGRRAPGDGQGREFDARTRWQFQGVFSAGASDDPNRPRSGGLDLRQNFGQLRAGERNITKTWSRSDTILPVRPRSHLPRNVMVIAFSSGRAIA